MSIDRERIKSIIESLIFVSEAPLPYAKIRAILENVPGEDLKSVMAELMADYANPARGVYLEEVAMGYQFRTRPENVEWVKQLIEKKPQKLSKASLETLAIIAYNQPITKPEIEGIRGVDSSSAINMLLEKRLIRILGRKEAPGKPFIFGSTKEFLELFNLMDLSNLPTLKEIESLEEEQPELFVNTATPEENPPMPETLPSGPSDPSDPSDESDLSDQSNQSDQSDDEESEPDDDEFEDDEDDVEDSEESNEDGLDEDDAEKDDEESES